jgi:hypothetical protein
MTRQDAPTLPTLDDGITLLRVDERPTGALQSLALDHLLFADGPAVWIDSRGNGNPQSLARISPSARLLDRVRIARAFTPWQHAGLLRALPAELSAETALVVLPEFDWFYREGDLARGEAERMLAAGVERVAAAAAESDRPVLVTRHAADELSAPIEDAADATLRCERTRFGPRFFGEGFETLVYPVGDGHVQTTIAYWRRVLATRHPAAGTAAAAGRASPSKTVESASPGVAGGCASSGTTSGCGASGIAIEGTSPGAAIEGTSSGSGGW